MSSSNSVHAGNGGSDLPAALKASSSTAGSDVERWTWEIGSELLRLARQRRQGFFSTRFWSDRLMTWAMNDPAFKVQLFRFVDVFPMLRQAHQVHEYLTEYLAQPGVNLPPWMEMGLKAAGYAPGVFASMIVGQIRTMAANFIAGTDAFSAVARLRDLWDDGFAFSVDLLGEACLSDAEALAYRERYLDLIQTLPDDVAQWRSCPRLESDPWGPVPRTNVSIKISSLSARTDPIDCQGSLAALGAALRPILQAAEKRGVAVNFDMEQHFLKDLTLDLFERACEENGFHAAVALQAYLRSGEEDARRIVAWTKRSGRQVTVRLIKGAYWDSEVVHAERMGWPVPVWRDKRATDACFERMTDLLLAAAPRRPGDGGVRLAIGSHNVRSIAHGLALTRRYDLPETAIEIQMLYGMADSLKAAAIERGLRVRQYVPIGEMIPGMAYLVRRLLENTSNQSWLRAGFFGNVPEEQLLACPQTPEAQRNECGGISLPSTSSGPVSSTPTAAASCDDSSREKERHQLSPAVEGLGDGRPFFNEPQHDFSDPAQRERFASAVWSAETPSVHPVATAGEVDGAIARSLAAFPAWSDRDAIGRSAIVIRAAAEMRDRRDELWASWSARRARRGARPTPISARRSTSANTMRGWPCRCSARGGWAASWASWTRSGISRAAWPP